MIYEKQLFYSGDQAASGLYAILKDPHHELGPNCRGPMTTFGVESILHDGGPFSLVLCVGKVFFSQRTVWSTLFLPNDTETVQKHNADYED